MDGYETNPFQELYVTDSPDPRTFVALFSSFPVRHALALFRPGHVVVKGIQGSGKSMLLNLFRTQIRLAYYSAAAEFPVPRNLRHFVGAGINLTRSGVLDIGSRPISNLKGRDDELFPLYFADFLNYYVVRDVLNSIDVMRSNSKAFESIVDEQRLDNFACALATDDCWFGALKSCTSFSDLCARLDERISAYRSFHLYNLQNLPDQIEWSKTNIGEPIAQAAELLRHERVIPEDTPVYIRIDQLERLYRSDTLRPSLGTQYRQLINKAVGLRDSRVWYRVGTRNYAWSDDLRIFRTKDRLEHLRDFRVIDLDDMLRRKEDTKTWIFPKFAEDAFGRRLQRAGYVGVRSAGLVRRVFGAIEDPSEMARRYSKNSSAWRVLKLDDFPSNWQKFLESVFSSDPLSATLAGAWGRQRGSPGTKGDRLKEPPPIDAAPWKRSYWRKERIRQALLQISARSAQRLKWSGQEQVLALSAGNISIFLSICHEVWDAFLRAERRKPLEERRDPFEEGIHPDIQAVGMQTASTYWYDKLTEQPNGDDRRRFLDVIAGEFKRWLLEDDAMSYPGHNGFSLLVDELQVHERIDSFLKDSADYGDLYEVIHTTKEKNRRQRLKWYISPILSVYYQLPESHVKEPYYAKVSEVAGWLKRAEVYFSESNDLNKSPSRKRPVDNSDRSPSLFDSLEQSDKE